MFTGLWLKEAVAKTFCFNIYKNWPKHGVWHSTSSHQSSRGRLEYSGLLEGTLEEQILEDNCDPTQTIWWRDILSQPWSKNGQRPPLVSFKLSPVLRDSALCWNDFRAESLTAHNDVLAQQQQWICWLALSKFDTLEIMKCLNLQQLISLATWRQWLQQHRHITTF